MHSKVWRDGLEYSSCILPVIGSVIGADYTSTIALRLIILDEDVLTRELNNGMESVAAEGHCKSNHCL
ncbi:MAG: hypothetical protein NTV37_02505 [Proteobacteria bacterium]|nr:hypothetical protein [Pseudomonadota bacterium]